MSQDGDVLIICDGGLSSLVACTQAAKKAETRSEPPTTIAWFVPTGDETDEARRNSMRAISTLLGLSFGESPVRAEAESPETPSQRETRLLLECAAQALAIGVQTVTWAIQPGGTEADEWPDLDDIAERMDRALFCARLALLDAGSDSASDIRILTPLIDFTDRQLAELAADLAVAVETCWWYSGAQHALASSKQRRWKPLLDGVGLTTVSA